MRCLLIFVVIFCISTLSCSDNQKSNKENLEMQAMCSKGAKDYFNEHYPEPIIITGNDSNSYKHHYNNKLNKCFILIDTQHSSGSGDNQIVSYRTHLYDVYENKQYAYLGSGPYKMNVIEGHLPSQDCDLLGKKCNAEDFRNLIKSFMEE